MKFYPSITKNDIPADDRPAWLYLSRILKNEPEKGITADQVFESFMEQVRKVYPELPSKMVWGNYLIAEFFEHRISLSIDYENKDEMMAEIIKIAKEQNLVVFEPKSEKIHRP